MTDKTLMDLLKPCTCPETYCIERHGDGWALYLGRCDHRHGYNLANIAEPDLVRLNQMVEKLNAKGNEP